MKRPHQSILEYVGNYLQHIDDYKNYKFAFVDKSKADGPGHEWIPISVDFETDKIIEVDDVNLATKTHSNVLCWKKVKK